jgi:peptidase E
MLAVWRVHGVDEMLREAWERGVVLCGVSAGMICWFEAGSTDSFGPVAPLNDGLGLLPGSACPHYDGEPTRRPQFHRFIAQGFPAGLAADDCAALVFAGRQLVECVSSIPTARCYRVFAEDGNVIEETLATRYLGA